MAATKKFMVGKGNIWIFPGKWWFDCLIVITGHCFEKTSLLLVVASQEVPAAVAGAAPSAASKKWWHVADAEIERMLAEKQGKDQVWWLLGGVKDGDLSNLEVLSSYCLFFFWGDEKSVPIFFDSLFLDASQRGCSCSFFGLEVTVRWCTASSLLLVALSSTIFPFFEDPC